MVNFPKNRPALFFLIIPLLSLFMHWQKLPLEIVGLHNMRQAQTQQNVRLFLREDFNILNPRVNVMDHENDTKIYRYEFPIMQWFIAVIFNITGEYILISRLIVFLIGCFSMFGIFKLSKLLFNPVAAFLGTYLFSLSPLFFFYSIAPMPDNLALCGAIWFLYFLLKFHQSSKIRHIVFSAFFISLGMAAKLPYIVYIAATGFLVFSSMIRRNFISIKKEFLIGAIYILLLIPTLIWYAWVIPTWDNGVVKGIFSNSISLQETINILRFQIKYIFLEKIINPVMLPVLLISIYFFIKNKVWRKTSAKIIMAASLGILFYWIYEFNMIERTHDYYMMPFLPIVFIIVTYGVYKILSFSTSFKIALGVLLIIAPFYTNTIAKDFWAIEKSGFNLDVFRFQRDLKNAVPKDAKCIIINDDTQYVFSYLIDKKAFIFRNDYLPGLWVKGLIKRRGISHLYSTSRKVDNDPEVIIHLDSLIMERGEVKVFKLKDY